MVEQEGSSRVATASKQERSDVEKIRRAMRKKKSKQNKKQAKATNKQAISADETEPITQKADDVEIVYERELPDDTTIEQFKHVFDFFATPEQLLEKKGDSEDVAKQSSKKPAQEDADLDSDDETSKDNQVSKRKKKMLKRLSVATLKQIVKRPDVVEVWDTTASDPRLLVFLKAYRNTVPVPRHWLQKRKYLQNKRGIEKPPFRLPEFIENTGISKLRQAVAEKDDAKSSKQKAREKIRPKMGKLDIDYQVLQDAFFKYQTKPKLSVHGDMYYEGKETEVKMRHKKPGMLSEDLKKALSMPEGAPPPWLINMQRYGPPPSYPTLKIAGLNAPIPEGASFGYHAGGWGKPPVDELGRPLYGDVFGSLRDPNIVEIQPPTEVTRWGELEEVEEEEEEVGSDMSEEEGAESAGEEPTDMTGITSVTTGLETPQTIDLRKTQKRDTERAIPLASDTAPKVLYQVLEQRETSVGGALYGSTHTYVLPGSQSDNQQAEASGVTVALDPSELDNEGIDLQAKYQQHADENENNQEQTGEENAKKRKGPYKEKEKAKKYKEFKF